MSITHIKIKLATIFPIFNGLSFTKNALKTIYQGMDLIKDASLENMVIVVDDGSTDGSANWILENYPDVVILKGDGNLWWSGGVNKGIKHAIEILKCDYVLWWNNDIHAEENYYSNVNEVLNHSLPTEIIGSKIYYSNDPKRIWSMGGYFNPGNGKKYMIGFKEMDEGQYERKLEVDWLPGMGTIIHASVFGKIGFVDELNFPQYHGDSDFIYRAKVQGINILIDPSLKIWNNTDNSGFRQKKTVKDLKQSVFGLRSNYNIKKDLKFYRIHSTSFFAYKELIRKYFLFFGGFVKWWFINLFKRA